ncbi:hypothetical protein FACS1894163_01390 [Spirochaetia bacterium]|nr:hypothetical protein FACS1894163_01390 [Spirochaetia bacterium]
MLNKVPALSAFDLGNGVCRYLKNNLCLIYENRPLICNVEKMYNTYFKETMSEKDYLQKNIHVCEKLQNKKDIC